VTGVRVLVVTTVHTPLDARIHRRQIAALTAAGVEVTYAAPWSATGSQPGPGVAPRDLPRATGRDRLRALVAARRLLADEGPRHDLVLLHDPDLLAALPGLRRRLPPIVWDVHEDTRGALTDRRWLPAPLRPLAGWAVSRTERWAERHLHLLLAERAYRSRFRRVHPVVPNVPPVSDVPPPPGRDRVVYLGRVSRLRGATTLLALAARLAPELRVEVIGPADADVEQALSAAHADGRVTWHGFVPNDVALEMVRGATAGLVLLADHPNYRVSLPTKLLEYLACGVPVVSTPLPEAVRLIEETGGGVVVPFGDADAAEAAIRGLVADDAGRHAMGRAGYEAVRDHHAWDVEGPRFVELLRGWAR
jgi:glycosyltransferase involved in cell wall biosynthesis